MKYTRLMVSLLTGAVLSAFFFGSFSYADKASVDQAKDQANEAFHDDAKTLKTDTKNYPNPIFAAQYLSSLHAQNEHNWNAAARYLEPILKSNPENLELLKKAMILNMGAGNADKSLEYAHKVHEKEPDNSLTMLFLASEAFNKDDYKQAGHYIANMEDGNFSRFLVPMVEGWSKAAVGIYDVSMLTESSIHLRHALLIALHFDKKEEIDRLAEALLNRAEITKNDFDILGHIYANIGAIDKAKSVYEEGLIRWPQDHEFLSKRSDLEKKDLSSFESVLHTPKEGVARAYSDMTSILYQEYADDSAQIFAQLGIYLDPKLYDLKIIMANIKARHERYDEAIAYYKQVPKDHDLYFETQRVAADLLEDSGQHEEAISFLKNLSTTYNDVFAQIKIGDILRREENFKDALGYYNKAARNITPENADEFWNLYYVRGMAYERLNDWDKAEADLKKALEYQPDHPYVLNYLAYSWADKGMNLSQSLDMLKKAVSLRPEDGFILDSLGWVYYKMGEYEKAVPYLEKAVKFEPYDPVINDHLGDAYWQVGRKLEARFQWERSKNHTEDEQLMADIQTKLDKGLKDVDILKEAHSNTDP